MGAVSLATHRPLRASVPLALHRVQIVVTLMRERGIRGDKSKDAARVLTCNRIKKCSEGHLQFMLSTMRGAVDDGVAEKGLFRATFVRTRQAIFHFQPAAAPREVLQSFRMQACVNLDIFSHHLTLSSLVDLPHLLGNGC